MLLLLLLLLKSVEFDDDVALLLSVAGFAMGPHVTSESEIGSTDSAALRTSRACLRLCGNFDIIIQKNSAVTGIACHYAFVTVQHLTLSLTSTMTLT